MLKNYYKAVREMVKILAKPGTKFVFHDHQINREFRPDDWNDLFDDTEDIVYDHHYYQAWNQNNNTVEDFCNEYERYAAQSDKIKYDVWNGEWSLATDFCAHWLGGFNEGNGVPQFDCQRVDCPQPYMTTEAVDFDRTAPVLGPFGQGDPKYYNIMNGQCTTDSGKFTDDEVKQIAKCALTAYNKHYQGHFLWAGHVEIEPRWDFIRAYDAGWLNQPLDPTESASDDNTFVQN